MSTIMDKIKPDTFSEEKTERKNTFSGYMSEISKKVQLRGLFKRNEEREQETENYAVPKTTYDNLPPEGIFNPDCGLSEIERYWLNPPHSYVRIIHDQNKNLSYQIHEPKISEKEHLILEETDAQLRSLLIYDSPTEGHDNEIDQEIITQIVKGLDPRITDERISIISYYLKRNFHGYGKLDPLIYDENIEDITCNGSDIPVYLYHQKYANIPTNLIFRRDEINRFAQKLAQKADKQLSLTTPLVDATLPGGARAQITYTDVISSKGSSFTIRKFKSEPMTPVDLLYYRTYNAEIMAFLWLCVENRKSLIVVGGTASGKTSTMNALSLFIPQNAKIVSLEDTREIQMPHENWLPMKTRESTTESQKGNVDMFSLLKSSLRQRPEYIIVGEVRGEEAQTLFQAMNTGHTTYSTLHAGGVEQAINRLTTNPINVPVAMFGALDLMIVQQLQYIDGKMVRRCTTLNEIITEKGAIEYNTLFKWNPILDDSEKVYTDSQIINDISYSQGWTLTETEDEIRKRKEILEGLLQKGMRKSDEITAVFDEFRKTGSYEFN